MGDEGDAVVDGGEVVDGGDGCVCVDYYICVNLNPKCHKIAFDTERYDRILGVFTH